MEIIRQIKEVIQYNDLGFLIQTAAVLVIGLILVKILLKLIRRMLDRSNIDSVLYSFVINCVKIICLIVLLMTVLNSMGIPTSSFLTVLAAAGAAVALAVKDYLSNFAGGLLIILTKPFSKGDLIESGGIKGKVQEINLFYSKLYTYDNKIISVPNTFLANNTLVNYFQEEVRRIDFKVGAGYEEDTEHVKAVLYKVAEESELLLTDPAPLIGVADFADSAVIYDIYVWCKSDDYFNAEYQLHENIKKAFDKEGINIPYSQLVVHFGEKTAAETEIQ